MDLKFKVADIPPDGINLNLQLTPEEVREEQTGHGDDDFLKVCSPLKGRLKIEPTGSQILVRGGIETMCRSECARCLEEFDQPAVEEIVIVFKPSGPEKDEEELEADSLNIEYYSGEEMDLWPVIREHLVLGLPIKPLCREDCLGLCPGCGQNLNLDQCECRQEKGHPGLAALKNIRDKLPE